MISKALRTTAFTALLVAALPLAASAMTIGVTNELDTTISSGHLCQQSSSYSAHTGTEWTNSNSAKYESGSESGSTGASVTDPASAGSQTSGNYVAIANSSGGSSGSYASLSQSSSSVTGGVQASTSIAHTVSTFANP